MLFGHQANDNTTAQIPDDMVSDAAVQDMNTNPLAVDAVTGASVPATSDDNSPMVTPTQEQPSVEDALSDETTQATPEAEAPAPEETPKAEESESAPEVDGNNPLLELKQQALGELAPLVTHLEQNPEEKFRTTMMMIQSTDNQELLKDAHAAALSITDDKVRAQALLDVINEINYFTQKKD